MSVHSFQNMIISNFTGNYMWNKYRNESQQTICVIGVLILATKLCKADGHFSTQEEMEILKIIPHEPQQKNSLIKIMQEANKDTNPIEHDAKNLKMLLKNEHPEFLEFIVAVLYRLAHSDGVYSVSEDEDIREVAKIFEIKKSFLDYSLFIFNKLLSKFKQSIPSKKVKINA